MPWTRCFCSGSRSLLFLRMRNLCPLRSVASFRRPLSGRSIPPCKWRPRPCTVLHDMEAVVCHDRTGELSGYPGLEPLPMPQLMNRIFSTCPPLASRCILNAVTASASFPLVANTMRCSRSTNTEMYEWPWHRWSHQRRMRPCMTDPASPCICQHDSSGWSREACCSCSGT